MKVIDNVKNELDRVNRLEKLLKNCEKSENDVVKHPSHYCYSKYEPKDVIREWGLNFNLGSAVKYIARAGRKDDIIQDLSKAKQFLEFEIEYLEKQQNEKSVQKLLSECSYKPKWMDDYVQDK
jgi:hypothetical protein